MATASAIAIRQAQATEQLAERLLAIEGKLDVLVGQPVVAHAELLAAVGRRQNEIAIQDRDRMDTIEQKLDAQQAALDLILSELESLKAQPKAAAPQPKSKTL